MNKIIMSEEFLDSLKKERVRIAGILERLDEENTEPEEFEFDDYVNYLTDIRDMIENWTTTE